MSRSSHASTSTTSRNSVLSATALTGRLVGSTTLMRKRLRLGSSDVCIVRWLKEPQATMLVGGVVADGGPWLRYLITPICRLMSIGWLEELAEQGGKADYVACALIFDADRQAGGPRDVMDRRVYQVTGNGLAVIR